MPTGISRSTTLEDLVERLRGAGSDLDAMQDLFENIGFGREAIEKYCHFERDFYTRNLIARNDDFELLALCWEPGQITPIHDHAGSEGWMHCMYGEVEEVHFHVRPAEGGELRVERGASARASAGNTTHINDGIAWHTVANPTTGRSISLHLYAGPIDSCRYFDPESRTVRVRRLTYHSPGVRDASRIG